MNDAAPRHWLMKSEPEVYGIDRLASEGTTLWDGIRNYQARNFMRSMKIGDMGFFYHSNEGREVVGIVEVCKLAHRDSTSDVDTWECVDIRAVADVPRHVTLDEIKADPKLKGMVLVTNSRLSVQPVSETEFKHICKLGGAKI